jgi:metal-sulfur cluster biosynthetic enzyme/ribosomal protein L22
MTRERETTFPGELWTVEPQLRLTRAEAETALTLILGEPVLSARTRLRFGPGRTCEVLARVLDRAVVRAEGAGLDPGSLVVAEGTAWAAEDIVRVRRKGYGVADWISSPACSVRVALRPAGLHSTLPAVDQPPELPAPAVVPSISVHADAPAQVANEIRAALSEVIDPDLGVNVVDLGFVRAIVVEGRTAMIAMTLTSAACPLTEIIEKQVSDRLAGLHCIDGFRVDWQWLPAWRPSDTTVSGREQLRAIGFTI